MIKIKKKLLSNNYSKYILSTLVLKATPHKYLISVKPQVVENITIVCLYTILCSVVGYTKENDNTTSSDLGQRNFAKL